MKIDTIEIVNMGNDVGITRIDTELKSLILSTEGTIPGSRGFGLTGDFVGKDPHEAANLFAIDLEEKVIEYIPEITIASVEVSSFDTTGSVDLRIHVERRDNL